MAGRSRVGSRPPNRYLQNWPSALMQQLRPATVLIVSMASLPCGFRAAAVAKKAKPCFRKRPMRYLVAFDFWPTSSGAKRFMPEAKRNRQTVCRTIGIRWASVMAQLLQEARYSCCPSMPAYWWRCAPMRPKPPTWSSGMRPSSVALVFGARRSACG